jgi:NAD(P)-dependent dehydrogenase (short-subunit alcohol dehydrogenase family)
VAGDLAGRVAVVTGGSKGIGKGVAAKLLDDGASVVIVARKQAGLDAAVSELGPGRSDRLLAFAANVGDSDAAQRCADATVERFGRLDILVNNAATSPYFGPLMGIDAPRAEKTAAVNQLAPLLWTQVAWRASMEQYGGAVVNIATIGAHRVERGFAYYNVTKAALEHLTRHLASELAPGVRVNAIAPGPVRTDLSRTLWGEREHEVTAKIPLRRLGEPSDIAEAVAFLVSDRAAWITGVMLFVDGGVMVEPSDLLPM